MRDYLVPAFAGLEPTCTAGNPPCAEGTSLSIKVIGADELQEFTRLVEFHENNNWYWIRLLYGRRTVGIGSDHCTAGWQGIRQGGNGTNQWTRQTNFSRLGVYISGKHDLRKLAKSDVPNMGRKFVPIVALTLFVVNRLYKLHVTNADAGPLSKEVVELIVQTFYATISSCDRCDKTGGIFVPGLPTVDSELRRECHGH